MRAAKQQATTAGVRTGWPGRVALVLCLLLWARTPDAWAQADASVFGRVTDESGAPVAGVTLLLRGEAGATLGALSGADGAYELGGVPPGRYRFSAERLGFQREERPIQLSSGERARVDLRLRQATIPVEGVVVRGRRDEDRERARFENEPGLTARVVTGESLKVLPGLAEADVLRAVEVLPGVVSTSDFSSAFNVRGGSADQNLILLDGFPIFNPFHLGGLFSVFNSDAIARAELMAGGFGAEYGGRVSSVLNVETRSEEEGLRVEGGVSLLASRVLVRSPVPAGVARALGGEGGSWLLSARRSYFDQILSPLVDFPYHLTDLQGFAEVGTRGGGRLSLTAYGGEDVLDLSNFTPPGGDSASVLRVRWKWGNRMLGLRWRQPAGGWLADTRLGYSSFSDRLGFVDFGDVRFASRIGQLSLHSDWRRDVGSRAVLKLGGALQRMSYDNVAEAGGTTFFASADHGVLGAGYGSVRWSPSDRWIVEPGVRVDRWAAASEAFTTLSPRFAVKRFLGAEREAAVKLSVGRYTQFLHSLRDESLPISNDTWVVAGPGVPPVVSDQLQAGLERYWGDDWSVSLEAYLRRFRGITELNLADDPNDPADDLLSGDGRSYGLDLLLRRSSGRITGWTTISLLRAEHTLPDPVAAGWEDLPPTTTFPPVFDRRVDVDLVLQAEGPYGTQVGVRWNFGSPIPYTRPTGQFYAWRYSPMYRRYEPVDQPAAGSPLYVMLGPRNAERYPPYHRLDATLRRTFRPRWGAWTPYLQVLNLYNRKNVLWYFYRYDRVPPTRSGLSMFPVLPAVGVEVSF